MVVSTIIQLVSDPTSVLVGAICALVIWYFFRSNKNAGRLPPGPRPWPIVGSIPLIRNMNKDIYEVGLILRKPYGDVIRLRLGPSQNFIFINGSDNIHKAGKHDKLKYRPEHFFTTNHIFKKRGLFFGNGDMHTKLRKFTLGALRDFGVGKRALEEQIQEEARLLADLIEGQNGAPCNYLNTFKKCVSNVIASIVFGNRFEYDDPEADRLISLIDMLFRDLSLFLPENVFPWLRFLPGSKLAKVFKTFESIEKYAKGRIAEHRETFDPDNIRDFVDLYLKHEGTDSDVLTEDNMFRVIVDLFNAGTDTTATSLIWGVLHLIRNPDVQKKCREETMNVIGSGRQLTLEDKRKLPYLQAFINETLRYSTIAPISPPHTCLEDIEFNGYFIPKNSIVVFNLYSSLMDSDAWQNPDEFRPERFLTASGQLAETKDEFIPFSTGARSCIGSHLARMELFLFMGTLIQKFEFKLPPGSPLPPATRHQTGITTRPVDYKVCAIPLSS